jgi:hypothetical protein
MSTWDDPTTGAPPPAGVAPVDPDVATGDDEEDAELVRPFVITGGRTRHASVHLRVETLVVATVREPDRPLQFEHAQILAGDLAEAGLVQIHEARQAATPALLLRMIDAVRAL